MALPLARQRGASLKTSSQTRPRRLRLFRPRGRSSPRASRPVTRAASRPLLRDGQLAQHARRVDPAVRSLAFARSPDNARGVIRRRALGPAGTGAASGGPRKGLRLGRAPCSRDHAARPFSKSSRLRGRGFSVRPFGHNSVMSTCREGVGFSAAAATQTAPRAWSSCHAARIVR